MTNLNSILKSRDITLSTKVCLVKAMVFPVVMYGCESWTTKKAEHRRIDAFELWCWRRLLRVRWTARRSNQSILKETSPKYSLEGLMLKLKLQYFGHLMRRADSFEKTLMLGRIEGGRRRGWQRMRWLDGIINSMDMSVGKLHGDGQGGLVCCGSWGHKGSDTTEWLNWTELADCLFYICALPILSHVWLFVTPWTVAYTVVCPWDSPGKNIGVVCHALLQGIFPTQGSNPGLPHCRWILYPLSHQGSPFYM